MIYLAYEPGLKALLDAVQNAIHFERLRRFATPHSMQPGTPALNITEQTRTIIRSLTFSEAPRRNLVLVARGESTTIGSGVRKLSNLRVDMRRSP